MTYKKYIKPVDIIVYNRCKKGEHWKAQLDGVKPGSITSSLHKLLRLGYIDSDYRVIKEMKKTEISIKIGRGYLTVKEILDYVDKYGFSIIDNTQEKNLDFYEIDGVEKNRSFLYKETVASKIEKIDREMKINKIIYLLPNYENLIINSKSGDEYEVTSEDIFKIAESIIDDIQGNSFQEIFNYIEKYIGKNEYFDLG